ncbi:MAG: hypothetical protein HZA16_15610 [Nitrospirae bacterium]|nr:hypothetical protein [Nitrospirota bacterium]
MTNKFSVPIIIEETFGIDRSSEPVSIGIPFSRGNFFDSSCLELVDQGDNRIPFQTESLSLWPDGSIKWLLLDFVAAVRKNSRVKYELQHRIQCENLIGSSISINETDDSIIIDTRKGIFYVNKSLFAPFEKVIIDNQSIIDSSCSGLNLIDDLGRGYIPKIKDITVETSRPLRATLNVCGQLIAQGGTKGIEFYSRITFYSNSSLVRLAFTIRNTKAAQHLGGLWDMGDKGSFLFKDLSLQIALQSNYEPVAKWITQPEQSFRSSTSDRIEIYQDSSGGDNWNNTNHVNRNGKVMNSFKGYRVYGDSNQSIESGDRANPVVSLENESKMISVAMQYFWQSFPSAIEVQGNMLTVRMFPGQYSDYFELQGGEQKTHTIFLTFTPDEQRLNWIYHPVIPGTSPEYNASTEAFSYLYQGGTSVGNRRFYEMLINTAINGDNNFFNRREIIDEYGWRNFGDLFADHETYEQVAFKEDTPLVSHYNNQYDVIYSSLYHYARTGKPEWFILAKELADHVIDIDIYHTDEDRELFNKGMHWHTDHFADAATATHRCMSIQTKIKKGLKSYGSGPGFDHIYTKGLLYYYLMTGNRDAKDAVLDLADWTVVGVDEHISMIEKLEKLAKQGIVYLKQKLSGRKSASTYGFDGPGRPSGNVLNVLLDAYELTRKKYYLEKAEKLIRNCIHPADDVQSRDLLDPNAKWMYLVFLQSLGNYLDKKYEIDEHDYMFHYARETLIRYAKWMADYESPFLSRREQLDFPNYATRAAQDIRKCNVFLFAAKYSGPKDEMTRFLDKADYFFRSSMDYLEPLKTKSLTRPLAILMSVGGMRLFFDRVPIQKGKDWEHGYNFGKPCTEKASQSVLIQKTIQDIRRILRHASMKKEIRWISYRIRNIKWEIQNRI